MQQTDSDIEQDVRLQSFKRLAVTYAYSVLWVHFAKLASIYLLKCSM